jgi:uncharacterized protein YjbI with pentapeptide repeats
MTTISPPGWAHCGHDSSAGDLVGCRGITIPGSARCLLHADPAERAAYLASLAPGADLDLRGTTIAEASLNRILTQVTDPATGESRFGTAQFSSATFTGDAQFSGVTFTGIAEFTGATFTRPARFTSATFTGNTGFHAATFTGNADFHAAAFTWDAWFDWVSFERTPSLGPLVCGGQLDLSAAIFGAPITIEVAARSLVCRRTRWLETAKVWLRYTEADLSDAVFEHPVTIAARRHPFTNADGIDLGESTLAGEDPQAHVTSLQGVDAAHLILTDLDLDLSRCLFAGAVHLDQVRLEGQYHLASVPSGLRRRGMRPVRWTPRRALAEEHYWRAARHAGSEGWMLAPQGEEVLVPAALAPVYRQLRKSFEDGKHEPGAADFYYGEMEMRRHADDIPRGERRLLAIYWALSGYGLRPSRALGWLLAAMTLTMLVMMLWGVPKTDTPTSSTGTLTGRHIVFTTIDPGPANPTGPLHHRLNTYRFEKSLRVVVNRVIFRSSGQDLTTTGTYTEMASRLTEPILLGLAALAIRGRIKR